MVQYQRIVAPELIELGKSFKQAKKKTVTFWLVRLRNMDMHWISPTAVEAKKMNNITTHPSRCRLCPEAVRGGE